MKIGLIGCGKQAPKHISGLAKQADVELVVCDINAERARAVGEKFSLAWTDDVAGLLADGDITAVDIATPTMSHAPLVLQAIENGKHFFCEKPLCQNLDEARLIADTCAKKGLIGMVGYVYRYAPVFETGHALLHPDTTRDHVLGEPVSAWFRIGGRGDHELWKHKKESSGGATSEMLVHMLDLAIWYFGAAKSAQLLAHELRRPIRHIAGADVTVDAEDFVLARFEMENGGSVFIQSDLLTPAFSQHVEMQFERGTFLGSIQADSPSFVFATAKCDDYEAGKTPLEFGPVNLFERQMGAFCEHVRSGTPLSRNSVEDSLKVMEALEMLRQQWGDAVIGISDTSLTENEIEAAIKVLRSGMLRQGKESDAFEEEFAEKVGAAHAVTCANGSAALHLAYLAALEPGDEVLVPAFTFIATGSMASIMGAKPIFCDVDPNTFLLDLDDARSKITAKTKGIAPVHLFGNPCDIDAVQQFAADHGLKIFWDAAQSHGATHQQRDVGSFDDFVCYSFYPSKNMFVGEGGMVCTNNAEYENKLRYLRSHGQTGKYHHTSLGLNYRLTDMEAAIGREQLKRLDSMLASRRRNAQRMCAGLDGIDGITAQTVTAGGDHAWHQFCVLVDKREFGCDRDALSAHLKTEGVMSGIHYPRGLHQQPIFEELYGKSQLPVTEDLSERILALPIHHSLVDADIDGVLAAIAKIAS